MSTKWIMAAENQVYLEKKQRKSWKTIANAKENDGEDFYKAGGF